MGTPGDPSRITEVKDAKTISQLEDQTRDDNSNNIVNVPNTNPSTSEMTVITHQPCRLDPTLYHQYADPNNSTSSENFAFEDLTLDAESKESYSETNETRKPKAKTDTETKANRNKSKEAKTKGTVKSKETSDDESEEELTTFQEEFSRDLEEPGPSGLQTPKSTTKHPSKTTSKPTKRLKKTQSSKKPHTCHDCQKQFPNASKLKKHQQIHSTAGSPFKCDHCKKTFSSKFKLVRHVLIHSDCKPFSCSMCERTFHRKDHLKNHIKVHSPCKKLYLCEKESCKKEYTSSLSYKKHLALHAAEDGSLVCQICSKSFKSKEEILFHLKIHAGSRTVKNPDEKKYSCDHCARKFFTRKDVRRHLVVHTGRRDFLCQFCPQRFGRKDHLVRHIKKSHTASTVIKEEEETAATIELPTAAMGSLQTSTEECTVGAESISTGEEVEGEMVVGAEVEESDADVFIKCESDENTRISFATDLDLDPLFPINYLPQSSSQGELADLGCEVLDVIPEATTSLSTEELFTDTEIGDSLIMDILEKPSVVDEQTAPLPAFNIFFQSPTTQNSHQPPPPS